MTLKLDELLEREEALLLELNSLRTEIRARQQMRSVALSSNLLTPTERKIFDCIMRNPGQPYKALSGELFISERTIKFHMANIFRKFNVGNRQELHVGMLT